MDTIKNFHSITLLAALLLLVTSTAQGQCAYTIGDAAFSGPDAAQLDMATNEFGELYAAFSDASVGNRLSVMRYDGTDWIYVGTPGVSNGAISIPPSLSFNSSGAVAVAYQDAAAIGPLVQIFDGTSWNFIGSSTFINFLTANFTIELEFIGDTPFVSQDFSDGGGFSVTGFLYDELNNNWVEFFPFADSLVSNHDLFLDRPNNVLYLSYHDSRFDIFTVFRFDFNNPMGWIPWAQLSPALMPSTLEQQHSIYVENGILYFAYQDASNNGRVSVQTYDGTSWDSPYPNGFSVGAARSPEIRLVNFSPYVSYIDEGLGDAVALKQFNPDEGVWEDVVAPAIGTGGGNSCILLEWNNEAAVGFIDENNGSGASAVAVGLSPEAIIDAPISAFGCNNTSVDLDASLSTSPSTALAYSWSTGSIDPFINVTTPDIYAVTITVPTAVIGCVDSAEIEVIEDQTLPGVNVNTAAGTLLSCITDQITLDASGSTGSALEYAWSTGDTTRSITIFSPDFYKVIVTDGVNGCVDSLEIEIIEDRTLPQPILTTSAGNLLDCATDEITIDASGSVGQSLVYDWSTGASDAEIIVNSAALYTLTLTDGVNGCVDSADLEIFEDKVAPTAVVTTSPAAILACDVQEITLDASGSTGQSLAYSWSTGETDPVLLVNSAGNYALTVTDLINNCTDLFSIAITSLATLETNFLTTADACAGESIQFIDYSVIDSNDLATATFFWDFGNGDTSTDRDPVYAYGNSGSYEVNLEVSTDDCPMISMSKNVTIIDCFQRNGQLGIVTASVNPTFNQGQFEIQAKIGTPSDLDLQIYNFNGALVASQSFENITQLSQSLTLQDNGIYYIHLVSRYGVKTLKTIVIN
ncbi:MAG: PKD domain-containing protein [Bacteroidota bacterium]